MVYLREEEATTDKIVAQSIRRALQKAHDVLNETRAVGLHDEGWDERVDTGVAQAMMEIERVRDELGEYVDDLNIEIRGKVREHE